METRTVGAGLRVPALGLGCAGMSGAYGPADEADSIATIHAAIDAGLTLLDTADFYGMGHSEMLIGRALRPGDREKTVLSVKFGGLRGLDGGFRGIDARPVAVQNFLAYSLRRLGTDYVDIYRPARLDPAVPIEDTIGAIAELVQAGYVRGIGLSEVGAQTIRRAHAVHPITDLEIEYSLFSRGIEDDILATCRELGIGITAYGVLAQGLLSGTWQPTAGGAGGRAHLPRFRAGNVEANLALVDGLREIAAARGATVRATGDRLGARARRRTPRHRRAGRGQATPADRRRADRGRPGAHPRRPGRDRAGGPEGGRRRRPVRPRAARPAGQRTLMPTGMPLNADTILSATEEVIRRHGPAKATVLDVARALGVSHTAVYKHFPSKAALREAVTRRWLSRDRDRLAAIARDTRLPSRRNGCTPGSPRCSPPSRPRPGTTRNCSPPTGYWPLSTAAWLPTTSLISWANCRPSSLTA